MCIYKVKKTVLTLSHFISLAYILFYFGKNNCIGEQKILINVKKPKKGGAVVPGSFSRSRFKVSDQTKEYLIKRNRLVIFSSQV